MEMKRALISVDKEAYEGTHKLLKEMKISNQVYNAMINEFIRVQYKLLLGLKTRKDSGVPITMGDFLQLMGGIISDFEKDQLKL